MVIFTQATSSCACAILTGVGGLLARPPRRRPRGPHLASAAAPATRRRLAAGGRRCGSRRCCSGWSRWWHQGLRSSNWWCWMQAWPCPCPRRRLRPSDESRYRFCTQTTRRLPSSPLRRAQIRDVARAQRPSSRSWRRFSVTPGEMSGTRASCSSPTRACSASTSSAATTCTSMRRSLGLSSRCSAWRAPRGSSTRTWTPQARPRATSCRRAASSRSWRRAP
mmetsp:Transcript_18834/g.50085  ORF Transcript_18834/g.50085 Transcript_18834/m.50085 type:complete len:222 (-) Transcript_18834:240-905(-)